MSLESKLNSGEFNLSLVKPSVPRSYEFEDFRLDVEHLMLYRNGEEVSLTPKQVETLLALVERGGEIVSKDVLMSRLWGTSAVEESNLIQNIYSLRRALGNTSDGKEMIETLRRRGYRFTAKLKKDRPKQPQTPPEFRPEIVKGFSVPSGPGLADGATVANAPKRGYRWTVAISAGVIVALLSCAVLAAYLFYGWGSAPHDGRKTLAVLPIHPINSKNRDEIYEIGIADQLIYSLGKSRSFTVRPISSTRKYINIGQDPVAAGRELGVDFVVASTYQVANGKIQVTSQLIGVSSGRIEDTFQSTPIDTADLFGMQHLIATDLAGALCYHDLLAPSNPDLQWRFAKASQRLVKGPFETPMHSPNEEAYRHYLQAVILSDERDLQKLNKAIEHLGQAVSIDPKYAISWAEIAHLHNNIAELTDSNASEHYEKSKDAVAQAIVLDPSLSKAYSARCSYKERDEYDFGGAEMDCRRALELDPDSPVARRTYASFLYSRGRFEDAIAEVRTAIDLDPTSFQNQQTYGSALYYARRYSESEEQFKKLLELNPNDISLHVVLTRILEEQGKESEAFEYFVKSLEASSSDTKLIERLKSVYSESGWRGVTIERIKSLETEANPKSVQLACLYAKIGDKDRAFEYLEKAYRARSSLMGTVHIEPQLDALRDDPRYADLIKRIGVKDT